jgi:hypothetical protein
VNNFEKVVSRTTDDQLFLSRGWLATNTATPPGRYGYQKTRGEAPRERKKGDALLPLMESSELYNFIQLDNQDSNLLYFFLKFYNIFAYHHIRKYLSIHEQCIICT